MSDELLKRLEQAEARLRGLPPPSDETHETYLGRLGGMAVRLGVDDLLRDAAARIRSLEAERATLVQGPPSKEAT